MIWTNVFIFISGVVLGWVITQQLRKSNLQSETTSSPPVSSASSTGDQSRQPVPQDQKNVDERFEQLELAYRMAIEMGKFKAGFLARTSHELRSPLNSIMSLQQLILTDLCDSPEEEREFVAQSYAASQKLLALLNETTNISKLEEGTLDLVLEPLSLADIFSEVESLTRLQALNRNLRLMIEAPSPDIFVMGDRRWVRQVLVNLVTTAIFQMNNGTIQVNVQADEGNRSAHIYLEDERSPTAWSEPINLLAPPSVDQQPISKASAQNPESHAPNGLTLAITQIMMEKMNGELSLLSAPLQTPHELSSNDPNLRGSAASTPDGTRILCSLPLAAE
ncbi:MAG: HAMP domain-containing sensor histidine kinase [Cyanobacteria bacterium P01_E01_bin.6]